MVRKNHNLSDENLITIRGARQHNLKNLEYNNRLNNIYIGLNGT